MLFSHLQVLAALELIMPTQEKDLGFTEWVQHSVFTENKIPSCKKKTQPRSWGLL